MTARSRAQKYLDAAADYCEAVVDGTLEVEWIDAPGDKLAPKYVKLQCAEFLRMWRDEDERYFVDRRLARKIVRILMAIKCAKGFARGRSVASAFAGFDWMIVIALLCCKHRDNPSKRRYQKALLEICRKNGKTFVVAVLFLLLFMLEPDYSRFFSVAPDGDLAREIKQALEPLINANAEVLDNEFKVLQNSIRSKVSHTEYKPLNYSTNRMDGKEPDVFIADEIGALPTNYAIEAMESGQMLVDYPLGFCVSTKYPTADNPLEDEVDYAKQVLDGLVEDDTLFALLYEPDEPDAWMTDDAVMAQGNPLGVHRRKTWEYLERKRTKAIGREKLRENFLTKHCNIIYQGAGTEAYIPIDQIKDAGRERLSFAERELYVGVDLAMTTDNCAVAVAYEEDGYIVADVTAFIPEDRLAEKSKAEKVDYTAAVASGKCVACGDLTVDYSVIEEFVEGIEERYGGRIVSIGYDRYNALSSAKKWEAAGYTTVEIKQHSSVLHPPTKLLAEKAASRRLLLLKSNLLEINFENCRCTFDTNMNRYVTKKRSRGKVDMVVALINAIYLLQQDVIFGDDWVCQD